MNSYLIDLILLFSFYSFIGWSLETIFASIVARRFINRGFLSGPFCPIYGFGAILIIQFVVVVDNVLLNITSLYSLIGKIVLAIVLTSLLEYFTGLILEKIFGCRWWDYSNEILNIKGRICLKYSLLWGILACILIEVINPLCSQFVAKIILSAKYVLSIFILGYYMYDTIKSINEVLKLRQTILTHQHTPVEQFLERIEKYKRIFFAFPKLYFLHLGKINKEIRGILNDKMEKLKTQIKIRNM